MEKESVQTTHDVGQSRQQDANMYPTGFRLFFLAGASIMGVFLISLDQVSSRWVLEGKHLKPAPELLPPGP